MKQILLKFGTRFFSFIKVDKSFKAPKVSIISSFKMPSFKSNAFDFTITHVFFNYFKLALETKLSEATDSGNIIQVEFMERYLTITLAVSK